MLSPATRTNLHNAKGNPARFKELSRSAGVKIIWVS